MKKFVFRTHIGTLGLNVHDRECGCQKGTARDSDREAVAAMTAHRFLPPQESAKLASAHDRATSAMQITPQPVLNSAADRVKVEPTGVVAAIRARSAK